MADLHRDHTPPMDGDLTCDNPLHGHHLPVEAVEDTIRVLAGLPILDDQVGPIATARLCLVLFAVRPCRCENRLCTRANRLTQNTITHQALWATCHRGPILRVACDLHEPVLATTWTPG